MRCKYTNAYELYEWAVITCSTWYYPFVIRIISMHSYICIASKLFRSVSRNIITN